MTNTGRVSIELHTTEEYSLVQRNPVMASCHSQIQTVPSALNTPTLPSPRRDPTSSGHQNHSEHRLQKHRTIGTSTELLPSPSRTRRSSFSSVKEDDTGTLPTYPFKYMDLTGAPCRNRTVFHNLQRPQLRIHQWFSSQRQNGSLLGSAAPRLLLPMPWLQRMEADTSWRKEA